MKISLKHVLAVGALAVASTSAFADIVPSGTVNGNGELSLIVWDTTTGASYFRGLQIQMDNIATTTAIAADGAYAAGSTLFSVPAINLSADANLQSFLSSAQSAGDSIQWGVIGGAAGANGFAVGKGRYVTTTGQDLVANSSISNNNIKSGFGNLNAWDGAFNGVIATGVPGDGKSGVSPAANATFTSVMNTWAGNGVINTVDLGSTANFYLLTTSDAKSGDFARVYSLQSLTLSSNGALTSAVSGPVTPIPAAFWLLGTGLAGLVGIGRRKNA